MTALDLRLTPTLIEKEVESTYVVLDSRSMAIKTYHRYLLWANSQPERFYFREYKWESSGGIERLPLVRSGLDKNGHQRHTILRPICEEPSGKRIAVIDLGRILEKGAQEELELEHFFISVNPSSPSHVGYLAKAGTEKIVLRAVLPRTVRPTRVLSKEYLPGTEHPSIEEAVTETRQIPEWLELDDSWMQFVYTVDGPIAGRRYRLQWDHQT